VTDALPDTLLVDLLARMLSDRSGTGLRALADYQADFPAHAAAVETEWRRMQDGAAAEAPASDGRRVGPYRLVRELGRGGQGAVWLAHDERLRRHVALKLVPRSPLVEDLTPRFRREAEVAGGLDHPGLCPVYDVGHDESVAWIALRYVEGETLAARIARGPLPRDEALRLIESAARALHVAHAAGVVHRDVKPGNLMITPAGDAVVLDFGVARPQDEGPPITLTGDALGTPAYMSPEALDGAVRLDARADVWALGVSLYEALAGRRPFGGPTREALVQSVMQGALDVPREWGRDLGIVLRTALSREPAARYRTAADLAEDLRRLRAHESILARPTGPLRRLLRWRRRNPALANSLLALAAVLVAGLAITALLLASTQRSLADVRRLSDHKLCRDLTREAATLWPATPDRVPAFQRWLDSAQAVLGRAPLHREALALAGGRADPAQSSATRAGVDVEREWLRESLADLLDELDALTVLASNVQQRRDFAHDVRELTIERPAEAWRAAAAAVAADPRFEGLVLVPQLGLIPLGADPDSQLQEFAVPQTGDVPARGADGHLPIDPDSAVILVLIPGGEVHVGASPETDKWCGEWDGPPQTLRLDPYFIGKHEITQAQWARHTGRNPSTYQVQSKFDTTDRPPLHPVESVSWDDCSRVLGELGLQLPTEVQWERAARGGTTTPWWSGAEPSSLAGCANVADSFAKTHGGMASWLYVDIDDGELLHAEIGKYRANPFGLHDTIGNVSEWCRGTWEDWAKFPPRPGDGLCTGEETAPSLRGGNYADGFIAVRSSARRGEPPAFASFLIGVRAARVVER
jgi:serine/threonine protein kinase/formylglycine-generating enzyme required for sulfatase activity